MAGPVPVVLLVEDEPAQRAVLTYNLEAEGFEVQAADNGEDALALIVEKAGKAPAKKPARKAAAPKAAGKPKAAAKPKTAAAKADDSAGALPGQFTHGCCDPTFGEINRQAHQEVLTFRSRNKNDTGLTFWITVTAFGL